MDKKKLRSILAVGETVTVEFKQCSNGISPSTYESVCSFLNRYGGDIFLGVENNGTVSGIPANAASDIIKNFIKTIGNPEVILPTVYLAPEILKYEGKTIVHIHVPPSSEVHSYKKVVYDRADDADVKVTATGQIAALYIRKQNIFTEKKIYPYAKDKDLRFDLIPRIRQMAMNRYQDHPWKNLSDSELLQSAGLIGEDMETGKKGYNLAAIMLLGRDDVILSVNPVYRTDALLRKVNIDRYDDRLIVETNLIDSYGLLMQFAGKHLLDKFYLEGDARVSLRNIIAREMLVNTLIHREFTSSHYARFIIEKDRMFTENANRAVNNSVITPDNFEPNPKNPIIAAFFRNIGLADELGSGVRKLYRYVPQYSGKAPELIDGDIFRVIVPLDDKYSYEAEASKDFGLNFGINFGLNFGITVTQQKIIELMSSNPHINIQEIADKVGLTKRSVEYSIRTLKKAGIVKRAGARKKGSWIVSINKS
ncbi:MAG: putative DNA binding domain-containing protein [Chitinispirillales bacterium]|jgi:ATP-dependent DNA helicase RecG|nr:putative DNA binding domain-containing protein [Chitinispirillales bacterium]